MRNPAPPSGQREGSTVASPQAAHHQVKGVFLEGQELFVCQYANRRHLAVSQLLLEEQSDGKKIHQ